MKNIWETVFFSLVFKWEPFHSFFRIFGAILSQMFFVDGLLSEFTLVMLYVLIVSNTWLDIKKKIVQFSPHFDHIVSAGFFFYTLSLCWNFITMLCIVPKVYSICRICAVTAWPNSDNETHIFVQHKILKILFSHFLLLFSYWFIIFNTFQIYIYTQATNSMRQIERDHIIFFVARFMFLLCVCVLGIRERLMVPMNKQTFDHNVHSFFIFTFCSPGRYILGLCLFIS